MEEIYILLNKIELSIEELQNLTGEKKTNLIQDINVDIDDCKCILNEISSSL